MSSFSEGFSMGSNIAQAGVESYQKAKDYRERLRERAEDAADSHFTPAQTQALKEGLPAVVKGADGAPDQPLGAVFPRGVPATALTADLRADAAAKKAESDMAKTHTKLDQGAYDSLSDANRKTLQESGYPVGSWVPNAKMTGLGKTDPNAPITLSADHFDKMTPENKKKFTDMGFGPGDPIPSKVYSNLTKPPAAAAMTLEEKQIGAKDIASGKLKDSDISKVFGRGSAADKAEMYMMAKKTNPNLDIAAGNVDYAAVTKRAVAQAGVQGAEGQKIGAAAGSMDDMLNLAEPIIPKVSGKMKTLNELWQKWGNETNDPDLKQINIYMHSAAGFYASLKKNGGTPDVQEKEEALKDLATTLDKEGFAGVRKALANESISRVSRIKGAGFDEKNPIPGPKKAPAVGTIEDGHRFNGGDPSDPKNWEVDAEKK